MKCKKQETKEKRERTLTISRLREALTYDSETGIFRWKIAVPGRRRIGDQAGWIDKKGHRSIEIDGKAFAAHHLAWFYVYKKWPQKMIDHKNRGADDNWINNLREATNGQNRANSRANQSSKVGLKGVTPHPNGRLFISRATVNKKPHYLGLYSTAEEAHSAYVAFAKKIHGNFFHDGN